MPELGETTDPQALIPGEPSEVAAQSSALTGRADRFAATADGLPGARPGSWQGAASEEFQTWLTDTARRWRDTGDASRDAAGAIAAHGHVLAAAQQQAADAVHLYVQGEQETRLAQVAHGRAVTAPASGSAPVTVPPFVDPGEPLRAQAREVLERARAQVVDSGDATAKVLNAFDPQAVEPASGPAAPTEESELSRIERFMWSEMFHNSKSDTTKRLKELNDSFPVLPHPEALARWKNQVEGGADWDHKGDIKEITEGRDFTPAPDLGGGLRFDIWSNIHYGYVGREAGFSGEVLSAGADVADIKERGRTDPADQLAVRIGIELHEKYGPDALRPEHIHEALRAHRDELVESGALKPF